MSTQVSRRDRWDQGTASADTLLQPPSGGGATSSIGIMSRTPLAAERHWRWAEVESRRNDDMVTVKYEDLELSFDFVSNGAPMEHPAYISMDTGKIYWVSELAPIEDELPDGFEESDRYLEILH